MAWMIWSMSTMTWDTSTSLITSGLLGFGNQTLIRPGNPILHLLILVQHHLHFAGNKRHWAFKGDCLIFYLWEIPARCQNQKNDVTDLDVGRCATMVSCMVLHASLPNLGLSKHVASIQGLAATLSPVGCIFPANIKTDAPSSTYTVKQWKDKINISGLNLSEEYELVSWNYYFQDMEKTKKVPSRQPNMVHPPNQQNHHSLKGCRVTKHTIRKRQNFEFLLPEMGEKNWGVSPDVRNQGEQGANPNRCCPKKGLGPEAMQLWILAWEVSDWPKLTRSSDIKQTQKCDMKNGETSRPAVYRTHVSIGVF